MRRVMAAFGLMAGLMVTGAVAQDASGTRMERDFDDRAPKELFKEQYYASKPVKYFVDGWGGKQVTSRMLDPTPLAEPVQPWLPPVMAKGK